MSSIIRKDIHEELKCSGSVKAGDYIFLSFCVGNIGKDIKAQVEGALDQMKKRLNEYNLDLSSVVQVTVLMKDVWNIPVMEEVFNDYFTNGYPARKTIQTEFAHIGGDKNGIKVQIDGIAYCGK